MCGIAGLIAWNDQGGEPLTARMHAMLRTIAHRGPDDEGVTVFDRAPETVISDRRGSRGTCEAAHVVLGHRRLSIIDLSDGGHQPMATADGQLWIVFNGEIYNYVELRAELVDVHQFRTHSDTEVLLAAYRHWGPAMLPRLDGMFAFVVLDLVKQQLFGARDAVGIKPFYFHRSADRFLFGSEPKTVLAGLNQSGTLNPARTAEFLLFGLTDHDEGTFFREVQQLRGGACFHLDLRTRSFETDLYWRPPTVLDRAPADLSERYHAVATEAVRRQLRSDVPVGSSLSGGIDSSTIVTLAGELLGPQAGVYQTLTFTSPAFANDESALAQQVATHAGMPWHPVEPSLDTMADDLERMMVSMGEPFSTLSMFAQYKVMERAGQLGLKVMLDGQGGDEVYLGYPRVAQRVMVEYLRAGHIRRFLQEWVGLKEHLSIGMGRSLLGNIYFNAAPLAIRRNMRDAARYVEPGYLEQFRPEVAQDFYAPKSAVQKQLDELTRYILPRLLRFADRNSMAFGVEQRVPHLSNLILDFALAMPLDARVHNGWTKYLVRNAMRNRIPDDILWSTVKRGFDIPQSYWVGRLAPRLRTWIEALPDDTPFRKDVLLADLQVPERAGSTKLWRAISVAAMMPLLGARS